MNSQSYVVNFWCSSTYDRIATKCWDWLGIDLVLVLPWNPETDITEDPLDSISQLINIQCLDLGQACRMF